MMAAALVAGAALQLQQSALWPLAHYAGIGLAALLAMTHFYRSLLTLCLCALIGFAWTGGRAAWFDSERINPALEGSDVQIVGWCAR